MHEGQLELTEQTVATLVAAQHPRWAGLPVRAVDSAGTVNALFRIGAELVARFPLVSRGEVEDRSAREGEARAASRLSAMTSVPVPRHVADGEPGPGCPVPWSVYTWLPGQVASTRDAASRALAVDLAGFVSDLREVDPGGRRFAGTSRGGPLADHTTYVVDNLRRGAHLLDVDPLIELWHDLARTRRADADVWSHGDLMPGNLLVEDGRLVAVLDVASLGPADPALDLQPAWNLLDRGARRALRAELGCDDDQWDRGRAWALAQASGCLWYYERTNPAMSTLAHRTLLAVLDPS